METNKHTFKIIFIARFSQKTVFILLSIYIYTRKTRNNSDNFFVLIPIIQTENLDNISIMVNLLITMIKKI